MAIDNGLQELPVAIYPLVSLFGALVELLEEQSFRL
jgi:hypothetical protein